MSARARHVLAAALALAALAGCTGTSDRPTRPGTSGTPSRPGVASSTPIGVAPSRTTDNAVNELAATPRSKLRPSGTLTWALTQPIGNFNPYTPTGATADASSVLNALLPRPYHFDAAGKPTVDTDYFTAITVTSRQPLTVRYRFNPRARWSNGRPLGWRDLAGLWRAATNPGYHSATAAGYDQIRSVARGGDDRSAVVTFARPFTDWQALFTPLVPAELTAGARTFTTAWRDHPAVTAGPFAWGSSNPVARTYTVVRSGTWWADPAELNSITFAVYDKPATAVQAIASHQVDYVDVSAGDAVANIAAARTYRGVQIRQAAGNNERQLLLNTSDPTLADVRVRQAVVLGIDRQAVTTSVIGRLGGNPTPLQNHFFVKNQPSYVETCGTFCRYDPARARALLRAAGWTLREGVFTRNGRRLALSITVAAGATEAAQEARAARVSLQRVGIELRVRTVPAADLLARYLFPAGGHAEFQLAAVTRVGTPFPVAAVLPVYTRRPGSPGQNPGAGGSSRLNALLATVASTSGTAAEGAAASAASRTMWAQAAWVPLYQRPQVTAVNADIGNLGAAGFADVVYQNIGYRH